MYNQCTPGFTGSGFVRPGLPPTPNGTFQQRSAENSFVAPPNAALRPDPRYAASLANPQVALRMENGAFSSAPSPYWPSSSTTGLSAAQSPLLNHQLSYYNSRLMDSSFTVPHGVRPPPGFPSPQSSLGAHLKPERHHGLDATAAFPYPITQTAGPHSEWMQHANHVMPPGSAPSFQPFQRHSLADPSLPLDRTGIHLAGFLLCLPENRLSASGRPERIQESVIEALGHLIDQIFETVIVGSSDAYLADVPAEDHQPLESTSRGNDKGDKKEPGLRAVQPEDIQTFLKMHFGPLPPAQEEHLERNAITFDV